MRELQAGDPTRIGPYAIHGRLGAGGMGRVYLGRSPGGRPVAVKVIHAELAQDPDFRARFRREIDVARRVQGFFTAPVLDADADADEPWLTTAYIPGPSLHAAVVEQGPLPVEAVRVLAGGLAEALAALHTAGVVHRDLKPSNVLLAEDGPRVIDFGISRIGEQTALTRTGSTIGSPGYLAPEQALDIEVGPAGDVFALGGVLAYASTGRPPFGGGRVEAVVYRVVHGEPDLDGVPRELRGLIQSCLAKDPEDRPPATQVLAYLQALGVDAHPAPDTWLPEAVTTMLPAHQAPAGSLPTPAPSGPPMPAPLPAAAPPHPAPPADDSRPSVTHPLPARPAHDLVVPAPPPSHVPTYTSSPWAVPSAEPRRRGRAGPIAAAVVACLLAVGTAVAVPRLVHDDSPAAHRTDPPTTGTPSTRPSAAGRVSPGDGTPGGTAPTATVVPPTAGTRATAAPPNSGGETRHSLQGITFAVPAGWTVEQGADGPNVVCVLPPTALLGRPNDGCAVDGVEIRLPDPPGDEWGRALDLESGSGWVWQGDAWCRGTIPHGSALTTSSAIVERGLRPVGNKSADYRRWTAGCDNGSSYHPRVWWLPVTKLSIETFAMPPRLDATADRIAASFDFSGYSGAQG
ncbi:serine/threonine protein kinase [Embleya sp. NPDC059237]|uniref:serine/threonine protein kinase n=1 Tax=Embleya sp. NPDC059237 TaxID=3346784 RepID=UPI0036B13F1A